MKKCTDCEIVKPYTEFHKEKKAKDGFRNQCKECTKIRKERVKNTCIVCCKNFNSTVKARYCSRKCQGLDMQGKVKLQCAICGTDVYRIPALAKRHKHHYCSSKCKNEGFSRFYSSENAFWYDKNKSNTKRVLDRKIPSYYRWKKAVLERDNYTCKICSNSNREELHVHHILNYLEHEDLRTDIDNGIVLCKACHSEFHKKYGNKENNNSQLVEFAISKHVNTEVSE